MIEAKEVVLSKKRGLQADRKSRAAYREIFRSLSSYEPAAQSPATPHKKSLDLFSQRFKLGLIEVSDMRDIVAKIVAGARRG